MHMKENKKIKYFVKMNVHILKILKEKQITNKYTSIIINLSPYKVSVVTSAIPFFATLRLFLWLLLSSRQPACYTLLRTTKLNPYHKVVRHGIVNFISFSKKKKKATIYIFKATLGFSVKNVFKWVQTCLVVVQYIFQNINLILRKYHQFYTFVHQNWREHVSHLDHVFEADTDRSTLLEIVKKLNQLINNLLHNIM